MKAGRMAVTYRVIADAMGLPPSSEILTIVPQSAEDVIGRRLWLVVSGDSMPEHVEGQSLSIVSLI